MNEESILSKCFQTKFKKIINNRISPEKIPASKWGFFYVKSYKKIV